MPLFNGKKILWFSIGSGHVCSIIIGAMAATHIGHIAIFAWIAGTATFQSSLGHSAQNITQKRSSYAPFSCVWYCGIWITLNLLFELVFKIYYLLFGMKKKD
jgi:hypothetical protein